MSKKGQWCYDMGLLDTLDILEFDCIVICGSSHEEFSFTARIVYQTAETSKYNKSVAIQSSHMASYKRKEIKKWIKNNPTIQHSYEESYNLVRFKSLNDAILFKGDILQLL